MISIVQPSFIQRFKRYIAFRKQERKIKIAITEADRQYKLTGKQHHVLHDGRGNYTVLCNDDRKVLNKRLKGRTKVDYMTLRKLAVYSTDNNVRPLKANSINSKN